MTFENFLLYHPSLKRQIFADDFWRSGCIDFSLNFKEITYMNDNILDF